MKKNMKKIKKMLDSTYVVCYNIFAVAGWSNWQLVGLITRRLQVQVLPPQPKITLLWLSSSVGQSTRFIPAVSGVQIPPPPPMWPLGQAVKTSPFHGGNRGSIPLGVTIFKTAVGEAILRFFLVSVRRNAVYIYLIFFRRQSYLFFLCSDDKPHSL